MHANIVAALFVFTSTLVSFVVVATRVVPTRRKGPAKPHRSLLERFYRKFNVISDLPPWHVEDKPVEKPLPDPREVKRQAEYDAIRAETRHPYPASGSLKAIEDFVAYNNLERAQLVDRTGAADVQRQMRNLEKVIKGLIESGSSRPLAPLYDRLEEMRVIYAAAEARVGTYRARENMSPELRSYTPADIARMTPAEYARVRSHLLRSVDGTFSLDEGDL